MSAALASCIGCGCDDFHACDFGCWWLRVDYGAGLGVCSECEDRVEAWDRGDRTSHAEPVAIAEARAEGTLRDPNPPAPAGTCAPGNHDWPYAQVLDTDRCRRCGITFLRHVFTELP